MNNSHNSKIFNNSSPYLQDTSLTRNLQKTNTISKNIGPTFRMSCDSFSIYDNCKDQNNVNLNYSQSNMSKIKQPKNRKYYTEYEEESEIKIVKKNSSNLMKSSSSKRDTNDLDNFNSTTKDTKDNKGDILNFSSNKHKYNFDSINNSSKKYNQNINLDYNTNYLEDIEIKNVKSSIIKENKPKDNYKVKAGVLNFQVSEFDANIEQNDCSVYEDCKNPNQKLTFNASFPFNDKKEICDDKKEIDCLNYPSEYISLETNAKDFCCSSKNSKCLII
jgi:hypothetical protein